ncbi:hypothetical protein GS489_08670 [Rhodococcus hoagii]|nr:hypothetical protein [Prescottella equi]
MVQHDLYRAEFWKHAGSESIADRMAVAATLGESNPAAQSAWNARRGRDSRDLRHRPPEDQPEHPSSQEEASRGPARRFGRPVADARDGSASGPGTSQGERTGGRGANDVPDLRHESRTDTTKQLSKGQALDLLGRANGDELLAEANDPRSEGAHVKKWVGRDADVDRAIAAHVPEWVPQADREAGQDVPRRWKP